MVIRDSSTGNLTTGNNFSIPAELAAHLPYPVPKGTAQRLAPQLWSS